MFNNKFKKQKNKIKSFTKLSAFNFKFSSNSGFVILIATLLSGLLLIVGASIFNISIKELILSSGGRESQLAFYAADNGIECALYWDSKNKFSTSSDSGPSPSSLFCDDQDITLSSDWQWKIPGQTTITSSQTIFSLELYPSLPNRFDCVIVSVSKDSGDTIIESRGYNTCNTNSPRRVERGLRVSY